MMRPMPGKREGHSTSQARPRRLMVEERRRRIKLDDAAGETAKTVEKIEDLYTSGLVDFQNVLDAQRSLFADLRRSPTQCGGAGLAQLTERIGLDL